MICYKCGNTLDKMRDICPKCGSDVRYYKKIVYLSNRYYNEGLLKAQARDLSGAKDALKKSLQLYKKNTNARNLLGLVYYAMGESAEALKEWVISRSFNERGNVADRYINHLKRNSKDLDSENHGIKKYNQALGYCKTGATDLAVIQLKKVISVHPNMTKAYELLALLYIDSEKYDAAEKMLVKCLEVDRGNPAALHMLNEVQEIRSKGKHKSAGVVGDDDREQLIIPVRFRDYGSYLSNAVYILIGALIGVLISWFVIVPGKVQKEMEAFTMKDRQYEEEISALQQELALKDAETAASSIEEEEETEETEEETEEEEVIEEEEEEEIKFLPVHDYYEFWADNNAAVPVSAERFGAGDTLGCLEEFMRVDPTQIGKGSYTHYRNLIIIATDEGIFNQMMAGGNEAFNNADFELASRYFDVAVLMRPNSLQARYMDARSYEERDMADEAMNRYYQIANIFGEDEEANDARSRYMALAGTDEIPGFPEGVDIDALTEVMTADKYFEISGVPREAAPVEEAAEEAPEEGAETPEEAPAEG